MATLQAVKVGDVVFQAEHNGISVLARVSKVESDEYWAELEFSGNPEAEKWKAEVTSDSMDVYAFGVWMDGSGLPVYFGDIDGNGKPELLATVPKGDLSPTTFRIFRWTGDNLLFVKKRSLVSLDGEFHWVQLKEETSAGPWIERFEPDGRAEILALNGEDLQRETVAVEPTAQGFRRVS